MHTTLPSYFSDRNAFLSGGLSCADRVNGFLQRIEENRHLNAFVEVFGDEARQAAAESDARFAAGNPRKLEGMVIGLKDNICYKDHAVTASSHMLEGYVSVFSATVTERLLQEGAIIIGRLNCDEFAMGSSNETSVYGKVLNPIDTTRVPGGSSGGSAAALAAGLAHVTLGSDTGGSIRQPAAFCGLLGLKPTYGRVSRWGLLAYGSSFDQIGPFTHTVQDAALVMEVI
ncbi:MAG: amidase, partial [Flavobacteriales bacterium]